jgi:hypothetical protein
VETLSAFSAMQLLASALLFIWTGFVRSGSEVP